MTPDNKLLEPNYAIILSGSPTFDHASIKLLPSSFWDNAFVIAVDKGLEFAAEKNLRVDLILGDFDSVSTEILHQYPNVPMKSHPTNKDLSDTEIAIDYALDGDFSRIFCLNMIGGRLDHDLFNRLILLKSPGKIWLISSQGILVALLPKTQYTFDIPDRTTFSLIPMVQCSGVNLKGCDYPLHNADLEISTLSLSNVSQGKMTIQFQSGHLIFFVDSILGLL
ncbi:MAG: thiamine diphosphokinase [Promethearchaeota archaeon]